MEFNSACKGLIGEWMGGLMGGWLDRWMNE